MGKYSEYTWEYLQKFAVQEDKDLTNLVDLNDLANEHLFDGAPLNVLSDTARSNFVLQFTLHFLQDECGFDNWTLWKLALAEKILNNNHKINLIYDNLMRQFYSEWETYTAHGHGTRTTVGTLEDIKQSQHTNAQTKTDNENDTQTKTNTGSQTDSGSNSTTRTLNTTDTETGSEIASATGNATDNSNASINESSSGNSSDISNGRMTETGTTHDAASETKTDSGTTTGTTGNTRNRTFNEGQKYEDDLNYVSTLPNTFDMVSRETKFTDTTTAETKGGYKDSNSSRNDDNSMRVQYDTPQGSLQNLRTPGGTPGGTNGTDKTKRGIAYSTGQTYNYMSAAEESDGTTWQEGDNTRTYGIANVNDGKYEEVTKTEHDIDNDETFDRTKTTRGSNDARTATITREIGNNEDGYVSFSDDLHGDVQISRNSSHHWTGADTEEISDSGSNSENRSNTQSSTGSNDGTSSKNANNADTSTHAEEDEKTTAETAFKQTQTTDSTNRTTSGTKTQGGTIADAGQDTRTRTDNLQENATKTRTATGEIVDTAQGNERNNSNNIQNEINGSDNDYERYKINFLQLTADNDLMQMLWDIFDDLFMMVY